MSNSLYVPRAKNGLSHMLQTTNNTPLIPCGLIPAKYPPPEPHMPSLVLVVVITPVVLSSHDALLQAEQWVRPPRQLVPQDLGKTLGGLVPLWYHDENTGVRV